MDSPAAVVRTAACAVRRRAAAVTVTTRRSEGEPEADGSDDRARPDGAAGLVRSAGRSYLDLVGPAPGRPRVGKSVRPTLPYGARDGSGNDGRLVRACGSRRHDHLPGRRRTVGRGSVLAHHQEWWREARGTKLLVLGNHDVDPVNQVRSLAVDRTAITLAALGEPPAAVDARATGAGSARLRERARARTSERLAELEPAPST